MDVEMFQKGAPGTLVPIAGTDPRLGPWEHYAFTPTPLGDSSPLLSPKTHLTIANARAALAALDSTTRQLPNPGLFRLPTLRREAQSTSALEGTYAPLAQVLTADEDDPASLDLREILNYVTMAEHGFARITEGRSLSPSLINELHDLLMRGTELEPEAGRPRSGQVIIGRQPGADPAGFAVHGARFVPSPPGPGLEADLRDLTAWMRTEHSDHIDPVVAAAMAHYQFETLHPYRDGNGRIGRYLIILQIQALQVLSEPTLTVSPWFEGRRSDYYDCLFGVSTQADWDGYVGFFASGLQHAADSTREEMVALVEVQRDLKDQLRASSLRAGSAHELVDLAIANPSFTVRRVESTLGLSYGRANKLVGQLVELGILDVVDPEAYKRRFFAPSVLRVLTQRSTS